MVHTSRCDFEPSTANSKTVETFMYFKTTTLLRKQYKKSTIKNQMREEKS